MMRGYLLLLSLLPLCRAQEVGVALFQTGDVTTSNSFLDAGLNALPSLRQVTLVTHLRLRRLSTHIPLLSYAVEESPDELFVELVPKKDQLCVRCCGGLVFHSFQFEARKYKWQHLCVSLDLEAGVLRVLLDGVEHTGSLEEAKRRATDEGRQLEVQGGGRLVVGQKLYSLTGDFMFLETLDGEVGDWRIYKEALPRDALLILSTCKSATSLPTPLYDLQNGGLEVIGETSTYNTSLEELCDEEPKDFFLFFPFWMTYKEAKLWCGKLKGSVILPKDSETNALLVDRFIAYRDTCAQIWTHLFWVEAEGDAEEDTWRNAEGELLSFAPFLQEYEAGQEEVLCAAAVSHNRYKWAASPCQMETCVLCTFNTHPEIRLYGLCDHSSLDRLFSFREHPNFELVFEGASHVVLAAQNGSWMMRSRLYPSLKAVMVAQYEGQDPVGVRTWEVEGDRCREKEVQLLLTSCGHEEYTCDDGSCVARTDRCDQRVQCPDQSDEKGCSVVLLPPGYSPSLPPPPVSASALPIALSLAVTSVREFDLSSFTISMDASLKLLWRDQRLRYSNLVGDYRINKLKGSTQVWLPSLELTDGTRSTVAAEEHSTATYVIRRSGSLPDDDATLRRDVMYSGKHNPLYLCQDLTLTFKCHFHLQMYPFDLQECHIVLSLHDVTDHVGVLVQDQGVVFEGARHLLEYTLLHEELEVYSEANLSHARITFMFHNQFSYYIANTFLPTFIQVLIGLATLKFDVADFQDRIMVSLTSLLVLATFFTQTSQSIPKTSYLKLIDVWFVTVIFLDFAMIISIVYVEILRLRIKHPIGGFFAKVAPVSEPQSGCFASCKKAGGSEARRDTFSLSSSKHEEVNFWLFKLFAWAVGELWRPLCVCVCMGFWTSTSTVS